MIIVGIDPSLHRSAYSVLEVSKDFTLQLLNKNFTLQNKDKTKYFTYINNYESLNKYFTLKQTSYLKTSSKTPNLDRINQIYLYFYNKIVSLKYRYRDIYIVIEESFVSNNSKTSITLGMVRSAIVLACLHALNNLAYLDRNLLDAIDNRTPSNAQKILFVSATNVKKTLCNNGKAEKKDISKAVKKIFPGEYVYDSDMQKLATHKLDETDYDVMDAIAIAMCGAIKLISPS